MKRLFLLWTALLLASAPLALAQAGGTYTTIVFPGANATVAEGIDSAGDVVGWFSDSSNFVHGFLLSGGVYTQLDAPGTTHGTGAYGINDVGQVVGGTLGSTLGLFVYDIQTQTYTMYPYSNGDYGVDTTGTGINNEGVIVGYTGNFSTGQFVGLELRGSTFKQVIIPNAYSTQLTSINNSGAVVGLAITSVGVKTAYLVQGGRTFNQIAVWGVPSAVAVAINDSNVFAGDYFAPAHDSAFEWGRMGLFKPINEPSENCTYANGINSAGQVAGYYGCDVSVDAQGFVWTPPAAERK